MKVLVTGPDGVLGHNLVRILLNRDYSVKVMVQPGRETPQLDELNIEKYYGDLLNENEVFEAVNGCDIVVHAAAKTDQWPCRDESYWKVNLEGTRRMIEASRKAGVKRFIHVGTANSFGAGDRENPGDENSPYVADRYRLDYISSKYRAHELVLDEVKKGFDAIIVNPTFMIGPYDAKPSSGAMIIAVNSESIPGYPSGGRNFVYVKDVAEAIVNAITMGKTGESYILGNHNLNYSQIFSKMADSLGVKAPKMKMMSFVTIAYGALMSTLAIIFRFTPKVNYRMSVMSTEEHFYNCQKAVTELKMPQTPIETAIDDAVKWFRENGYLSK